MAPAKLKSGANCHSAAANLANLLPTGTVLAFQAIMPSLSNNGTCLVAHKYLISFSMVCCSIVCFLSSFTDSFMGSSGKLYHGIATTKGLYILDKEEEEDDFEDVKDGALEKHRIRLKDILHAFTSVLVFLVFATSGSDVQSCFFPHPGPNTGALMMHLPILVGALASFLFTMFPTSRRGLGYADLPASPKDNKVMPQEKA